jgi:2,5-diketo-D-gluconate reductase A
VSSRSRAPLGGGDVHALTVPLVPELAAAHGRTPPQIVLRWHMQQGFVPIPKSSGPQRLRSYLDVFGFALSDAEMADLSVLDRGEQAAVGSDEFGH